MTEQASSPLPTRSVAFLGSLNLAAQLADRALVFVQIALVAAVLGVGTDADLFFLVSIVPLTVGSVLGEPIARAVLSELVATRSQHEARRLAAAGLHASGATVLAVTAAYLAVAVPVVASARPAGSGSFVPWLVAAAVAPALGLSAYLSALLLWLHRYGWAALRGPLASAASVAGVALAAALSDEVVWLVAAVTAGYIVTAAALYARVGRELGRGWAWSPDTRSFRRVAALRHKVALPTIGGLFSGQVIVLLERALAAPLGPGAVAAISYARGIVGATTVAGSALGAGAYPGLVRADAAERTAYVKETFLAAWRLTATASCALAAFLALFGTPTVGFLFQRGVFGPDSVGRVGELLLAFAPAIAAGGLNAYLVQALYGVNRFAAVFQAAAAGFVAYLTAAALLRPEHGLTGLAVAFSVSQAAALLVATAAGAARARASVRELVRDALAPVAIRVAAIGIVLVAYREAVEAVNPPVAYRGLAVPGGAALVLVAATLIAVAISRSREGERARSLAGRALRRR